MVNGRLIVVALGGNAISLPEQEGNVDEQFENSRTTARQLADLVDDGYRLVITHGNGPQIGNFLLRNEAAAGVIYPLPMEVASAHVQGGMGFMIAQALTNELNRRGRACMAATIVTTVLVDLADTGFKNPTKPIGRIATKEQAEQLQQKEGWRMKEVQPGKWRRVVPSPPPLRIMEIETIRRAVDAGDLIVACGGGGVPVARKPDYGLCGVRAVIDKDLASALLATELGAEMLLILTNIDGVCINYGKPDERAIERMTVAEARRWHDEGQFPPGSMGPKIEGAIEFLKANGSPDARVAIGPLAQAADTAAGRAGSLIVK
jgi:carbamate kinase